MGLGSLNAVGLKEAREAAAEARRTLAKRIDPIDAKRTADSIPTFGEVADLLLANKAVELRSDKSTARVRRALETYAAKLRPMGVDAVDTAAVLDVLKPIWTEKHETARNVRGYIEAALNAAKAKGYRTGDNPAAWRGHLDHLLPKGRKLARGHHPALPYGQVRSFVAELRERPATAARVLEFLILTASRSDAARGATWGEVDLEKCVWSVPAARMKRRLGQSQEAHRVPLSQRAIALLDAIKPDKVDPHALVFPGERSGKPLTDAALSNLIDRMQSSGEPRWVDEDGRPITVHGFRSTFRDWAGDETHFPRELIEAALAHVVGDEAERAYRRSDALEKRRALMEAWAAWCLPAAGDNVVQLQPAGAA
jgi:integrase